jgi:hypothetical protein
MVFVAQLAVHAVLPEPEIEREIFVSQLAVHSGLALRSGLAVCPQLAVSRLVVHSRLVFVVHPGSISRLDGEIEPGIEREPGTERRTYQTQNFWDTGVAWRMTYLNYSVYAQGSGTRS